MNRALKLCALFAVIILIAPTVFAQGQLDGRPYDPEIEPNIDMFIRSWKESLPVHTHGSIIEREILFANDGDPMRPKEVGAVLTNLKAFSHGVLNSMDTTTPTTLKDKQEIFYFVSGNGTITAGNKTADLYPGIGVLMPPGIEFTISNISEQPLNMYIITENIPAGFTPKKEMIVSDENVIPFASSNVHWSHCYKSLFARNDGLSTLAGMGPVWFNPMTMGQPHSHGEGVEEIWFALEGDITILLGKQIRKLPVGSAYKIPPNGETPHSTINNGDDFIKLFWFMN
ncbi:cupin domain-containing protein [Candidatus Latescibacterota bacterium]